MIWDHQDLLDPDLRLPKKEAINVLGQRPGFGIKFVSIFKTIWTSLGQSIFNHCNNSYLYKESSSGPLGP